MDRPSGTTIVTACLAGIALFGVVWSRGAMPPEPWPQQASAASSLADSGAIRLQAGAWRVWPAPTQLEPAAAADEPLAPAAPATPVESQSILLSTAATVLPMASAQPAAAPQLPEREATKEATAPARLAPPAADSAGPAPAIRPAVSEPPATEPRMRLAGPNSDEPEPPPNAVRGAQPAAPGREVEPPSPPQSPPKFGPAIFKELDRRGAH
jgi:hypothetical protein